MYGNNGNESMCIKILETWNKTTRSIGWHEHI